MHVAIVIRAAPIGFNPSRSTSIVCLIICETDIRVPPLTGHTVEGGEIKGYLTLAPLGLAIYCGYGEGAHAISLGPGLGKVEPPPELIGGGSLGRSLT